MIVDTSALVAVVFREPSFEALLAKLATSDSSGIGTPTLVETAMVLSSRMRRDARDLVGRMLSDLHLTEVPFGDAHWREAARAYERFGRGHHAARLNYGDCMTYAVASLAAEPLLFAGSDFSATDLPAA